MSVKLVRSLVHMNIINMYVYIYIFEYRIAPTKQWLTTIFYVNDLIADWCVLVR